MHVAARGSLYQPQDFVFECARPGRPLYTAALFTGSRSFDATSPRTTRSRDRTPGLKSPSAKEYGTAATDASGHGPRGVASVHHVTGLRLGDAGCSMHASRGHRRHVRWPRPTDSDATSPATTRARSVARRAAHRTHCPRHGLACTHDSSTAPPHHNGARRGTCAVVSDWRLRIHISEPGEAPAGMCTLVRVSERRHTWARVPGLGAPVAVRAAHRLSHTC